MEIALQMKEIVMRKLISLALTAAATVAVLVVGSSPAQAHATHYIYIQGGQAAMTSGGYLYVYDNASDGRHVGSWIYRGNQAYWSGWAPPAAEVRPLIQNWAGASYWNVCTEGIGCSAWHSTF